MRRVKAASVQFRPDLASCAGTVERVVADVARAAAEGARIVVFPETCVPYYPYFAFVLPPAAAGRAHLHLYEHAVTVPGPETAAFSDAARRHGVVLVIGVNEIDHGTLYNCQLVFDADGRLVLRRRKLTPSYHERMIWGQGDGRGLVTVPTAVGRVGALACWEHYNPLARFALMADHEEIHCAQFPGSMVGPVFAEQIEVTIRHHALEAGCFVINATGWLTDQQITSITDDARMQKALRAGCMTAIVSPEGAHLTTPLTEGEGIAYAELDFALIHKRKRMLDSVGHYARPDLFHLHIDQGERTHVTRAVRAPGGTHDPASDLVAPAHHGPAPASDRRTPVPRPADVRGRGGRPEPAGGRRAE